MKKLLIRSFTFIFLLSINAFADQGQSLAYVDMQKVLLESIVGKAAKNDLDNEIKKMEAKLSLQGKEIAKMDQELQKQASVLSKKSLADKADQLEQKKKSFEREVKDQREIFAQKNNRMIKEILEEINKLMSDIAEEQKVDFIVERDPRIVLYINKSLDLTDQVIAELNKKKTSL